MEQLAGVFAVDVAAYAVMSSHFHLVVSVDAERAREWSQDEVLGRWSKLYTGPKLGQQYLRDGEADLVSSQIEVAYIFGTLTPCDTKSHAYLSWS